MLNMFCFFYLVSLQYKLHIFLITRSHIQTVNISVRIFGFQSHMSSHLLELLHCKFEKLLNFKCYSNYLLLDILSGNVHISKSFLTICSLGETLYSLSIFMNTGIVVLGDVWFFQMSNQSNVVQQKLSFASSWLNPAKIHISITYWTIKLDISGRRCYAYVMPQL